MSSLFQWREPRNAVDSDWAIYCKLFDDMSSTLFKILLMSLAYLLFSYYVWGTKTTSWSALITLGIIFYFWLSYVIRRNCPVVLTDKGIRHHYLFLIPWGEIKLYSIENYGEETSSIRSINIDGKGKWYQFYFDTQQTNEADLRAVLNRFLPRECEMASL
jgi:hypothetical protein